MEKHIRLTKAASVCIIITFLTLVIYLGKEILFPLVMALLMAVLLRPLVFFLNNKLRFPNVIAVCVAVLTGLCVLFGIVYFMSAQIADFMADLPEIKKNIYMHFHHLQQWVKARFNISYSDQENYIENTVSNSKMISSSSIGSLTTSILNFVLIPIYTFLILLYRALFLRFLMKLVPKKDHGTLAEILFEIKTVIRSYISGLLLEVAIVAVMTAFGLWLIGVQYFVFLGIMTAILNLIPYIGIIVACVVSAFIALVGSPEPGIILGVIAVNGVVQFIDNNILIPKIVGSKVSINALASMVGVVVGGSLAGVAGMFLAIPVIAILKVVFDRIPSLKPFGFLMGDHIPKTVNWYYNIRLPDFNAGGQEIADDEVTDEAHPAAADGKPGI